MRRSAWFRSLASFLALWFPLIVGEPGLLHACPTHGAASPMSASSEQATSASGHGAHHAHMQHSVSQTGDHAHHSAPGHSHQGCTCIGCCSTANSALDVPHVPSIAVAVVVYRVARSVPSVESLARPAPEFSRPYTTGPPRA